MTIYAVNGKEPVAVWVPSMDSVGNGTTTLTDLIGSNDGTLMNMDAATDWVSDTGNGGVRALDLDGSNDYIDCGTALGTTLGTRTSVAVSIWTKIRTVTNEGVVYFGPLAASQGVFALSVVGNSIFMRANSGTYNKSVLHAGWVGSWVNTVLTYDGAKITVYRDGTEVTGLSGAFTASINFAGLSFLIGVYYTTAYTADMLFDDVRVFDQSLDSSDAAVLAAGRLSPAVARTYQQQQSQQLYVPGAF